MEFGQYTQRIQASPQQTYARGSMMANPDRSDPQHETVMDVTEEQIARVYAQAFMGVANKSASVGDLVDELDETVFLYAYEKTVEPRFARVDFLNRF